MSVQAPRWLPWLCPFTALLVGGLVGLRVMNGGFWTVLLIAMVGAALPLLTYRLFLRLRPKPDEAQQG